MPWQTATETGRVVKMAIAAENLAAPTVLPTTGTACDWTLTASGEAFEGWTVNTFDLAADDFEMTDAEGEAIIVRPPTAAKKSAIIRDEVQNLDQIGFTSFEVGSKIAAFATNVADATGVQTWSPTHTRTALLIEFEGLGLIYCPSVEIAAGTPGGGAKALSTQACVIEVFAGSSVTTGVQFIQLQDA